MYSNILKRDLKRKKTMNIILLLFTILASMFVSSGINNVVTVMNGTEYYLDKAGIGDYMLITQNGDGGVTKILESSKNVESYLVDSCMWTSKENYFLGDKREEIRLTNNTVVLQGFDQKGITYFTKDNEPLEGVKKGEIYVTAGFLKSNEAKVGDTLIVEFGDVKENYRIAGEMKDALLGSDMMGNTRFLINGEDYEAYQTQELKPYEGRIFYINTADEKALMTELSDANNILFSGNRKLIKLTYVMEMVVAMIVLVLSVCLCIVSFVLLKFVITFTINEEYRQIGVMKAIGIRNFKIRSLYVVKYFAMSVVGGLIGFFAGILFGNMVIDSVSEKMVLSNDMGIFLNLAGSLIVVFIMTGFAYLCTSKVKKSTPVDAIRNGQTGERYGKKTKFSLIKSPFRNAFYLALNDVLSAPKRFFTVILCFCICSLFVFGVVEVADTMKSDSLITTFCKKSDLYLNDSKLRDLDLMSYEGNENVKKKYDEIEGDLAELNMPGKVSMEIWYQYNVTVGSTTSNVLCQQNKRTKTTDYEYTEGSAPQNENEVAITKQISEQIGAKIGDTITIDFGKEKKQCLVVGYFQTMNQLGKVMRLHEDAPTSMEYASAMMGFQVDFADHPDKKVIDERKEILRDFYESEDVFNAAEFCDDCMKVAGTMDQVSKLLLLITCIIVILVAVLMERSFISDETSQIALLKAIGFTDGAIIRWQVYRFLIVAVISELLAIIFTHPVTKLWCDPIWNMMGATNVQYYFKPLSLLVIYPGIILIICFFAVLLSAGFTKTITCRDAGNIE